MPAIWPYVIFTAIIDRGGFSFEAYSVVLKKSCSVEAMLWDLRNEEIH